ncbi:MAG: hypothetical protein IPM35_04255 [Myxococcales bacterium]|nr:hypothetical protein [Myxococcales bacterium]
MIGVTASEIAWRAVLAALPRCSSCGGTAEYELAEAGSSCIVCTGCAASRPHGALTMLGHAEVVSAIESALLREVGL